MILAKINHFHFLTFWFLLLMLCACKPERQIDITYLSGMWQNVEKGQDVLMFSYNMRDNNTTKGFFRPGILESEDVAYGGSFNIKGAAATIQYRPYNTLEEHKDGTLSLGKEGEVVLPFGTYRKMSQSESIEFMKQLEK